MFQNMYHFDILTLDRIKKQARLEGIFKGHLVQPPCRGQGHLSLDLIAQ